MIYNKILLAVDSSEYSLNAVAKGLALAHQLQAKVALIYVVDTRKTQGNVDAGVSPAEALIIMKKEVAQTLCQMTAMNQEMDLLKFMPEGHPVEEIINTAQVWQADLIVMGTHGRTGLQHLLLGSVAEQVVHHATIPVLIVPLKK